MAGAAYQQVLWLHTMLRPITGSGSSHGYPRFAADGSADMRISFNHASPHRESGRDVVHISQSTHGREEPEPDRDAIKPRRATPGHDAPRT